jgi:hypothetical protein
MPQGDPPPDPNFELSGYRHHVSVTCGFDEARVYYTQRYPDSVVFYYTDDTGRKRFGQEAFVGGAVTCG